MLSLVTGEYRRQMLFATQFPLADLRPFLRAETRRLRDPWTFVRHVGVPDVRTNRGADSWPWEEPFWTSKRAILYPDRLDQASFGPWRPAGFRGAFRRLFWNESQLPRARLELGISNVGFRREEYYGAARGPDFEGGDLQRILSDLLQLPVNIASRGELKSQPLANAARPLARLLVDSTTRWRDAPADFSVEPWWVRAGRPLALVEYGFREHGGVPKGALQVDDARTGFTLHLHRLRVGRSIWPVWLIGVKAERDPELRLMRLHLTRLHAEVQTLRLVLEALGDEAQQSHFGSAGPLRTLLERYLDKAFGNIDKADWYGGSSAALFAAAREYLDVADPNSEVEFRNQLERAIAFRPQLARLLREKQQTREALYVFREVHDA